MKNDNNFELIEAYLEGKLTGEELKAFEKRTESDSDFASLVQDYSIAIKSIEEFGKQKLKNRLRKIHFEEITNKTRFGRRELLKLAAVFIGLLIVSGPFLYNYLSGGSNYQNLYADNFALYPDILSQRSENGNLMLDEAMSYYKNRDFENASVLFQKLDSQNLSMGNAIKLYSGISYLGAEKTDEAEIIFRNIINEKENPFAGQANWYLALLTIKRENPEDAKILLAEIIQNKSYNHAKATKLLDEID